MLIGLIKKTLKENKKSDETFENMSFVKMESSTLIKYSHVSKRPRYYGIVY
jgi:hypothetical protein